MCATTNSAVLEKIPGGFFDADAHFYYDEGMRRVPGTTSLLEAAAVAEAESLQAIGETELAEQVIQQAVEAPPPVVVLPKETPKMKEMQARETWQFEVVDEKLVPREFMSPDPKKIGAVVRSQKKLASIPGVRIWSEKNFHGRTA